MVFKWLDYAMKRWAHKIILASKTILNNHPMVSQHYILMTIIASHQYYFSIPYSEKIWWKIKFDELQLAILGIKLNINVFTSKVCRIFLTLHHQKSAVYKAPLDLPYGKSVE